MPPQPLLLPQVPRYPGFEAALGAPRVDVVACREGEAPEAPHSDGLLPFQPDYELVEAGVDTFQGKSAGSRPSSF